MVSMEAKFCTSRVPAALCPELERTVATDAELKLALGNGMSQGKDFVIMISIMIIAIMIIILIIIMIFTCVHVKCMHPPLVRV